MLPSNFLPGKRVKTKERTVKENFRNQRICGYAAAFTSYDKNIAKSNVCAPFYYFYHVLIFIYKM